MTANSTVPAVHLHVEYFAGARDLTDCASEQLTMESDSPRLADLQRLLSGRHPRLSPLLSRMRMAQNGEFTQGDPPLHDGDQIAVLPPVAGGSPDTHEKAVTLCDIRDTPLSVDEALAAVEHPGAGGVALFIGVVRDNADGKSVSRLDYESHPKLAPKEMRRVLEAVARDYPGTRLGALHRIGTLSIGDRAVVLAASAPHRAEAFSACRAAIDRIKETVPIWKREWDALGAPHWVNLEER